MNDDYQYFMENALLHGMHCVSCSVLLTKEYVRKNKLTFWYCNRVGVKGYGCQNVVCSTCYCNQKTNRT